MKKSLLLTMLLTILFVPFLVDAKMIETNDKDKALEMWRNWQKAVDEDPLSTKNLDRPILNTGKYIKPEDIISLEYRDESQKELFDYTFKDGVITIKVKDLDVYNALKANKAIEGGSLDKKLSKYINSNIRDIGLKVKVHYVNGITSFITYSPYNNEFAESDLLEPKIADDMWYNQTDSKGKYYEFAHPGVLFYYSNVNTWNIKHLLGLDINYTPWNGEYLILGYTDNDETVGYKDENKKEGPVVTNSYYTKLSLKYELVETTSSDSKTNVKVTTKKNVDSNLKVSILSTNSSAYKQLKAKLDGNTVLAAYEISLDDYSGNIKVSLPVDSKYNGRMATVLHQKKDGSIETFERKVTDGFVEVTVNELSPFMVSLDKVNTNVLDDVPKTGDELPMTLIGIIALVSVIGAINLKLSFNRK